MATISNNYSNSKLLVSNKLSDYVSLNNLNKLAQPISFDLIPIQIRPISFDLNKDVDIDTISFIFCPDEIGTSFIQKHFIANEDVLDLNKPNDKYIDNVNQKNIDFEYNNSSINVANREITPKLRITNVGCDVIKMNTVSNNNETLNNELDNGVSSVVYNEENNPVYTLKPNEEPEKIIDCGNDLVFTTTESVYDNDYFYDDVQLIFKRKQFNHTNKINDLFCDAFIVNTDNDNNYELESFDNVTISTKDFNIASESSTQSVKSLTGKIRDVDSEFDFTSYTFTPHYYTVSDIEKKDSTGADSSLRVRYITSNNNTSVNNSLFITFDDICIRDLSGKSKDSSNGWWQYSIDYNSSNNYDNRNFFKYVSAGVHNIGITYYDENNSYDVLTKFTNNIDFLMSGEDGFIYKNMNRPIVYRKNGNTVEPMVSQSFRFKRDYILNKIHPHFIFPSNVKTYKNDLKLIVTIGFLINGKINENGFIDTQIISYDELESNNGDIGFDYPIWIPKNTDFFVGFTFTANKNNIGENNKFNVAIKCIENGGYDKSGNMTSFPSDVTVKFFTKEVSYKSKMAKIDLYVNTYGVTEGTTKYKKIDFRNIENDSSAVEFNKSSLLEISPDNPVELDRMILFNDDIQPEGCSIEYFICDNINENDNVRISDIISPNKEYISKERKPKNSYCYKIKMTTYDKFVSPIIKTNRYNFLTKCYNINTIILNSNKKSTTPYTQSPKECGNDNNNVAFIKYPTDLPYKSNYVTIRLKNLIGTYNACTIDNGIYGNSDLRNGVVSGNMFLIRITFDYWLNEYHNSNMVDDNMIPFIVDAHHRTTGLHYPNCYTKSYYFRHDNNIGGSADGVTIMDKKNENGWRTKTIEFIPLVRYKKKNEEHYVNIVRLEDWEFDIKLYLSVDDEGNAVTIRNVKTSVDTLQIKQQSND